MKTEESQLIEAIRKSARAGVLYGHYGKISRSLGLLVEAHLPGASVGSVCRILRRDLQGRLVPAEAEVVGFRERRAFLMPYEEVVGIDSQTRVELSHGTSVLKVGPGLLGRVIDGLGRPIDGKGPINYDECEIRPLYAKPTAALGREMVEQPLDLGVRAINGLVTCGKGQRIGIMAGSGVGKSVLLGMMARHATSQVNVIALIGERGREVREFIENELGPAGLARSVIVVSTSDTSALLRMRGAFVATSIAEHFRDKGQDVLLLMDSVTRFCMAQREIGLAMGEPPTSKGYTPSVFATLPRLLERAGMAPQKGSITGVYSVLVEGDELDDPVADSARSFLDGHVVLSRKIAQRNQFPAIDVLQSTSRVMRSVIDADQYAWAGKMREWMAAYAQAEDLINIGAYARGSNQRIDQAIAVNDRIIEFLKQNLEQKSDMAETRARMLAIVRAAEAFSEKPASQNKSR